MEYTDMGLILSVHLKRLSQVKENVNFFARNGLQFLRFELKELFSASEYAPLTILRFRL